jgi:hypothetical protein
MTKEKRYAVVTVFMKHKKMIAELVDELRRMGHRGVTEATVFAMLIDGIDITKKKKSFKPLWTLNAAIAEIKRQQREDLVTGPMTNAKLTELIQILGKWGKQTEEALELMSPEERNEVSAVADA